MTDLAKPAPAAIARHLLQQHDVIARWQALACGETDKALTRRTRPGGPWQRLLPGVYLAVTGTPTADQLEMATLLYGGAGSVLTGSAALRRQGLRVAGDSVDVLIPATRHRASVRFARVVRTTRMPQNVVVIAGRRYAMPARAVADAARLLTSLREVRTLVATAVQAGRCPIGLLGDELAQGSTHGSALLRQVLAEVADGIRSCTEADFRQLIKRARLPRPVFNARLHDVAGALIAVPDAWWPDAGVAAEVDSREWHLAPEDWQNTMARHDRMIAHGILVLHFSPRQIRTQASQVAATIEAALIVGRARPRLPIRTRAAAA
jgi:hypothetical protein